MINIHYRIVFNKSQAGYVLVNIPAKMPLCELNVFENELPSIFVQINEKSFGNNVPCGYEHIIEISNSPKNALILEVFEDNGKYIAKIEQEHSIKYLSITDLAEKQGMSYESYSRQYDTNRNPVLGYLY